jgi:hypothetical protein
MSDKIILTPWMRQEDYCYERLDFFQKYYTWRGRVKQGYHINYPKKWSWRYWHVAEKHADYYTTDDNQLFDTREEAQAFVDQKLIEQGRYKLLTEEEYEKLAILI